MEKNYTKNILSIISQEIENFPASAKGEKVNKRKMLDDQVNRLGGVKDLAQKINSSFEKNTKNILAAGGDVTKNAVLLLFYKAVSENVSNDPEVKPYDFTKDAKYDDLMKSYFNSVDQHNKMVEEKTGKKTKFSFEKYVKAGEEDEASEKNSEEEGENEKIDAKDIEKTQLNEFAIMTGLLIGAAVGVVGAIGTAICKKVPAAQKFCAGVVKDHPFLAKVSKYVVGFDFEAVANAKNGSSEEAVLSEVIKTLYAEVGLGFQDPTAGGSGTSAGQTQQSASAQTQA